MTVKEKTLEYSVDGQVYEGLCVWDDRFAQARPGVLVAHAWGGRSGFEDDKARWLASLGYVGFALDMYGKGRRGNSVEENTALMTPLVEDRAELQKRIGAALGVLREEATVDPQRTAAMGYCFGGLCVLDLARSGADVAGVVSLHGLLGAPERASGEANPTISAKVLCLHGYDDPMAPPQSVLDLAAELSAAGADWQLHAYGNTLHAFTNPAANDPAMGTVYSPVADARARRALENFLEEVLGA